MRVRQLHKRTRFPFLEEVSFPTINGKRTRVVKYIPNGVPTVINYAPSGWASFAETDDLSTASSSFSLYYNAPTNECAESSITKLIRKRGWTQDTLGYYGIANLYASDGNSSCNNIFLAIVDVFGLEFDPDLSTLAPKQLPFYGAASPPPPPPRKNMCGCDCNTIATIYADQIAQEMAQLRQLFENIKDHVDQRFKEEIKTHQKQLEALELDLQPVIDRINESESNLWNGIKM